MFASLFKGKKEGPKELMGEIIEEIVAGAGWSLSFQIREGKEKDCFSIDIFGEDEGLLKAKRGRLLLALQTYLFRALQKKFPDRKIHLLVDSGGFWEESQKSLLSLADRLIEKALGGRAVVLSQPLSPRQRRLVHERVAESGGLRSFSLGEGFYKTMRIAPAGRPEAEK